MQVQIPQTSIDELRRKLTGGVITPDDAEYDEARKIWNADIDRRPAAIAKCRNVADMQAALGFARKEGLPVAVRSGG